MKKRKSAACTAARLVEHRAAVTRADADFVDAVARADALFDRYDRAYDIATGTEMRNFRRPSVANAARVARAGARSDLAYERLVSAEAEAKAASSRSLAARAAARDAGCVVPIFTRVRNK